MIIAPSVNEGIIPSTLLNLKTNKFIEPIIFDRISLKNGSSSNYGILE